MFLRTKTLGRRLNLQVFLRHWKMHRRGASRIRGTPLLQSIASGGYDREKTSAYPECRKGPRIPVSEEILGGLGPGIDHRSGRRRSVGNLNVFRGGSRLRICHAVDRAAYLSTDGRGATDVRATGP